MACLTDAPGSCVHKACDNGLAERVMTILMAAGGIAVAAYMLIAHRRRRNHERQRARHIARIRADWDAMLCRQRNRD